MPFGLCNAPEMFQHLMQNCLGELNLTYALIYLDDIVIFLDTKEEHLNILHLAVVFEHFREHGLKLSQCNFFRKEINYLSNHISTEGMKPGMGNVEGIAEMVPPNTVMRVHHFLGVTRFCQRFIKGYIKIAQPLDELISGENSKLKNQLVKMIPEALEAFHQLKMKCMIAPVLAFADFKQPFRLETDASKDRLGNVLSQKQSDSKYHPFTYASWSLKGSEEKYHFSKLEFLALKWAIMDHHGPSQVPYNTSPSM